MRDINKSIKFWLDELAKFELTEYEKLPDIDLYMDQMITYLDRHLQPFATSSLDKQITSSMINNYVKGDCIPSPIAKKYNKEHIALILEICLLKKVLNISDIKQIFDINYNNTDFRETYNDFAKNINDKLHSLSSDVNQKIENIDTNDQNALINLALDLSLSANIYTLIAKRILHYLEIQKSLNE
jgi:hypothetical protein